MRLALLAAAFLLFQGALGQYGTLFASCTDWSAKRGVVFSVNTNTGSIVSAILTGTYKEGPYVDVWASDIDVVNKRYAAGFKMGAETVIATYTYTDAGVMTFERECVHPVHASAPRIMCISTLNNQVYYTVSNDGGKSGGLFRFDPRSGCNPTKIGPANGGPSFHQAQCATLPESNTMNWVMDNNYKLPATLGTLNLTDGSTTTANLGNIDAFTDVKYALVADRKGNSMYFYGQKRFSLYKIETGPPLTVSRVAYQFKLFDAAAFTLDVSTSPPRVMEANFTGPSTLKTLLGDTVATLPKFASDPLCRINGATRLQYDPFASGHRSDASTADSSDDSISVASADRADQNAKVPPPPPPPFNYYQTLYFDGDKTGIKYDSPQWPAGAVYFTYVNNHTSLYPVNIDVDWHVAAKDMSPAMLAVRDNFPIVVDPGKERKESVSWCSTEVWVNYKYIVTPIIRDPPPQATIPMRCSGGPPPQ